MNSMVSLAKIASSRLVRDSRDTQCQPLLLYTPIDGYYSGADTHTQQITLQQVCVYVSLALKGHESREVT